MPDFYLNEVLEKIPMEQGVNVTSRSMPDRHLMVDIESVDTTATAGIVAVAAAVFDPRSVGIQEYYRRTITKESNLQHGRSVSQQTLAWWEQQSPEAQAAVFNKEAGPLPAVMDEFTRWINRLQPTCTRIWAKSPDFDINILYHACCQLGIYWPFKFWETRCVRTIMELAYPEGDFPHVEIPGPAHDPLVDARRQVLQVQHSYHLLQA